MTTRGGATDGTPSLVYKQYRIHSQRMAISEVWIACIVSCGSQQQTTVDSLTATVTRVPKEYESKEAAVQAAKAYIDQQETHAQGAEKHDAPASASPDRGQGG